MMRLLTVVVLATSTTIAAQTVRLTDDDVSAAIAAGKAKKHNALFSSCGAKPGLGEAMGAGLAGGIRQTGSYDVDVSATPGHLALLAFNAARLYKPFTVADVSNEMREPAVFVTATPDNPRRSGNTFSVASPIESIVLKSKADGSAIQPVELTRETVTWKNLLGASFDGTIGTARFDRDAFMGLPDGDIDVVLITAAGERRCKIGKDDRQRIFGKP